MQRALGRMAEGRRGEFPVPFALLEKVLPQVFVLIEVKQDNTRLVDQRESVTEGQDWINEGKWMGRQKRLTAAYVPSDDAGIVQLRIAVRGVHGQRDQIFEPVGRQHRIEAERRAFRVQVGDFWLCVSAHPGNID